MMRNKKSTKTLVFLTLSLVFSMLAILATVSISQARPAADQEQAASFNFQEEVIPVAIPTAIEHPVKEGVNSCYDCHAGLDEGQIAITAAWEESVHGKAEVSCAGCHGGDPTSPDIITSMSESNGFIGVPSHEETAAVCGGCHSDPDLMRPYGLATDQYAKYITSVHGALLKEGDTAVAVCSDCHGSHEVKKVSDPTAPAYFLNISELCAGCHSDPELMAPYGIPTDQFAQYEESVHGVAFLEEEDIRAPNCTSCHGSHGAKPPQEEEVINVCGKCHTVTQEYYEESRHAKIEDVSPKCWTCHGTHDVAVPSEALFFHPEPPEQVCTDCHVGGSFRMDLTQFALEENRRCDTCHHADTEIYAKVQTLYTAILDADTSYKDAEDSILDASARGMIVNQAEVKLSDAFTDLITARATIHATNLQAIAELTEASIASSGEAKAIAEDKLGEYLFRRQAMIVVVLVIGINIVALVWLNKRLDQNITS